MVDLSVCEFSEAGFSNHNTLHLKTKFNSTFVEYKTFEKFLKKWRNLDPYVLMFDVSNPGGFYFEILVNQGVSAEIVSIYIIEFGKEDTLKFFDFANKSFNFAWNVWKPMTGEERDEKYTFEKIFNKFNDRLSSILYGVPYCRKIVKKQQKH